MRKYISSFICWNSACHIFRMGGYNVANEGTTFTFNINGICLFFSRYISWRLHFLSTKYTRIPTKCLITFLKTYLQDKFMGTLNQLSFQYRVTTMVIARTYRNRLLSGSNGRTITTEKRMALHGLSGPLYNLWAKILNVAKIISHITISLIATFSHLPR